MADRPPSDRLPIRLILPKQGKENRVQGGGSPPKPFRQVTDDFRRSLANQVSMLRATARRQVGQTGAMPVRVKLLSQASAKSHRPRVLFTWETCPIVGAGRLGELFIKGTPDGLNRLSTLIESGTSDQVLKEISSIESIEPVTPALRRKNVEPADLLRRSPRGRRGFITRVRLFELGGEHEQPALVEDFEEVCRQRKIRLIPGGYSANSYTYGAECRSVEDIEALARVVGVRSIASMPLIRTLRTRRTCGRCCGHRYFKPRPRP